MSDLSERAPRGISPDRRLLERATAEGFDAELLRQCRRLLLHEARTARRRAAEAPPRGAARAHLVAGKLAFDLGLLDRAAARAEAALAIAPALPEALRLRAAVHHRRGELSCAIAIWEALGARGVREASAIQQLAVVYELAARAEALARPRVPPAVEAALGEELPELEQSCRLALVGDVRGALRTLDRMIARRAAPSPHLRKVASIQRAWLLESDGDVQAAIATLERLADDRHLTGDVERLLCLAALYEREGTPERLRRAVRAVGFAFSVTRDPPLLRRLARLLRKLGHGRLALTFEARYLEVFRRLHFVPTVDEVLQSAAATYVPLGALRLPPPRGARARLGRQARRRRPEHRRRAAVLAAWIGDDRRARDIVRELDAEGHARVPDLLHAADVEERLGNDAAALQLRGRAVALGGDLDAVALCTLLGRDAPVAPETIRALGDGPRLAAWAAAIRELGRAHPEDPRAWRALAELERALGNEAQARDHLAHADAVERPRTRSTPLVLAAAAIRRAGEVRGLMHELWVERLPSPSGKGGLAPEDVLGSVTPELRAYAVAVFCSVRAFARTHFPHRVVGGDDRFLLRVTKDDEPSSGDSAGLPLAIVFLTALLELPPLEATAISGAVVCDAHDVVPVRRVGDVEAKIEGAFERRLRWIVLPEENRPDVERAERIPAAVAAEMVIYARTLEDACERLFPGLG